MKSTELIKLRFDVIELIYKNGGLEDRKLIFEKARSFINYIATGNSLKRPTTVKEDNS